MSTYASRYEMAVLNPSTSLLVKSTALVLMQTGTGAPGTGLYVTTYTDRTKSTISSSTGAVSTDTNGNLAFYADPPASGAVDIYQGGVLLAADVPLVPDARSLTPTSGVGYVIPAGWGSAVKAAVAASSSARSEWAVFGDSTTVGAGAGYSWLQRLRDRLAADGATPGGKGTFGVEEANNTYDSPEVNGFVSATGWNWSQDAALIDTISGESYTSNTAGSLTVQGYGNEFRLWYSNRFDSSDLGIAIDGGSETIVTPGVDNSGSFYRVTGLSGSQASPTLHTAVIRNVASRAAVITSVTTAPNLAGSVNSAPSLPNNITLYYWVTGVFGGVESTPYFAGSVFTSTTHQIIGANILASNLPGASATRWYRSTTNSVSASRQVGADVTPSSYFIFNDDYTASLGSTAPPTTSAARDTTYNKACAAPGFMFNTGIVVQKYARTGGRLVDYFNPMGTTYGYSSSRAIYSGALLGLNVSQIQAHIGTASVPTAPFTFGAALSGTTGAPRCSLAVLYLGFNDLTVMAAPWNSSHAYSTNDVILYAGTTWIAIAGTTGVRPGSDSTKWQESETLMTVEAFEAGVFEFCQMAKAAGADPLVIAPEYIVNANVWALGGQVISRMRAVALACGAAWADASIALGPPNSLTGLTSAGNPHLAKPGYVAIADYVYNHVLRPVITN